MGIQISIKRVGSRVSVFLYWSVIAFDSVKMCVTHLIKVIPGIETPILDGINLTEK